MAKNEKRPTAHKRAEILLKQHPLSHYHTLARIYQFGTKVPTADIPGLIEAFQQAKAEIVALLDTTIKVLERQMKEDKEKEGEEKKD